jgi:hypothetical protein
MLKKTFYKLHIFEKINLRDSELKKEFLNIFLLITLIIFTSAFFAYQGLAKAQETTTPNTSTSQTTSTTSNTSTLVSNVSCDALNTVKQQVDPSTIDSSVTTNTINVKGIKLNIVGSNDPKDIKNYITNNTQGKDSNGSGVVNNLISLEGDLKFDLKLPTTESAELKILVARYPGSKCLDQITEEGTQIKLIDKYFQDYNQSKNNIYTKIDDIPQKDRPDFLVGFHEYYLSKYPSDFSSYIVRPPKYRDPKDVLSSLSSSSYQNAILNNTDSSSLAKLVGLESSVAANEILSAAYKQNSDAKLVQDLAKIQIGDATNAKVFKTLDTQIEFKSENSFIGTQQFANNQYQNQTRIDNVTTCATGQYPDSYGSYNCNIGTFLTDKATYPIIDLYSVGKTGIDGGIKQPTGFATLSAAQSFFNNLSDSNQLKYGSPNAILTPSDPGTKLLRIIYGDSKGNAIADKCNTYIDGSGSCTELKYTKTFAKDSDELDISPKFGLPYGNANLNDRVSEWTNFDSNLNTHNAFSKANTGTVVANITNGIKLTSCPVAGACVDIPNQDIKQDLLCYTCGLLFGKKVSTNAASAALFSSQLTNQYTGTPIAREFYNYATDPMFTYGYIPTDSDGLSRLPNYRNLSSTTTFYNPFPHTNAAVNGQIMPIQSRLGAIFNANGKDYRIYNPGGLSVSNLQDNQFYGLVDLADLKNNNDTKSVVFKAYNAKDLSTLQIDSIDLSDMSKFITETGPSIFKDTTLQVSKDQKPQIGLSLDYFVPQCNLRTELVHSIVPMTIGKDNAKKDLAIYITNKPAHVDGNLRLSEGLTDTTICSRLKTADQFGQFSDPKNWNHPVVVFPESKFVLAKNPNTPAVASQILLISKEYDSNNHLTGNLRINNGKIDLAGTSWYLNDDDINVNLYAGYDLTQAGSKYSNIINVQNDFGINKDSGFTYDYVATIDSNGNKHLIVTSKDSDKILYYTWNSLNLRVGEYPKPKIYSISSFTNRLPKSFAISTMDVNPNTGYLAFGLNLNYLDSNNPSAVDENGTKTFPLVVQESRYGFVSYILDWKLSEEIYDDNTLNEVNNTQILKNQLTQIKFTNEGNLNGIMQMTDNSSIVFDVRRQASTQYVMSCVNNGPGGASKSEYTRFINKDDGKPNCNLDPLLQPTTVSNATYTRVLDISDDQNLEKLSGKRALSQVVDFNTLATNAPQKDPNKVNYTPADPKELILKYYGENIDKNETNVKIYVDQYKNNPDVKRKWDLFWPIAVKVAQQAEFQTGKKLDPEAIMAWYWLELGPGPNFEFYAENCRDLYNLSRDPSLIVVQRTVNRIKYPCEVSQTGIWQNAAYQMTDHGQSDYEKAFALASSDGSKTLKQIADAVISNSLIYTADPILQYDNKNGAFQDKLPFPSKFTNISDLIQGNDTPGVIRKLSNDGLFYLALLGKDPTIASYLNAKTIHAAIQNGKLNYGSSYKQLGDIFYAIKEVVDLYNVENPVSTSTGSQSLSAKSISFEGKNINAQILNVPYINQTLDTISEEANDPAKDNACFATDVAMIAGYYGILPSDQTELAKYVLFRSKVNELVTKFGLAKNDSLKCGGLLTFTSLGSCDGSYYVTVRSVINQMGMKSLPLMFPEGKGNAPSNLATQIENELKQGHPLITGISMNQDANGNYTEHYKQGATTGHAFTIVGISDDGKYIIANDPYNNRGVGGNASKTDYVGGHLAVYDLELMKPFMHYVFAVGK